MAGSWFRYKSMRVKFRLPQEGKLQRAGDVEIEPLIPISYQPQQARAVHSSKIAC